MKNRKWYGGIVTTLLVLMCGCHHVTVMPSTSQPDTFLHALNGNPPPSLQAMASFAMDDLIRNYWKPNPAGGEILPTWTGIALNDMPDPRGGIWERAMMLFAVDNYYQISKDPRARKIIVQEARRLKRLFQPHELEQSGALLHTAVDDCGWNAALYLVFYRYTKDKWMLERAVNLLENTYAKWLDDALGGGLWYRDEKDPSKRIKSIYAASIVLDSLEVWQYTGNPAFHDRAVQVYEWMHTHHLHPAGIYFCDYNEHGPLGKEKPDLIQEASSVSFLGGNMMMAVLHARMYALTHEQKYLDRAKKTAQGILDCEVRNGLYLNDRDAWTNTAFMGAFVREVLVLPEVNQEHRSVLYQTAQSILRHDRTPDGHYGGSWAGPADGPGSQWSTKGSIPTQIMTSATSVNVILSATAAEKATAEQNERPHHDKSTKTPRGPGPYQ